MKKVFALTLAVAMVLSLASVAFAASRGVAAFVLSDSTYVKDDGKLYEVKDSKAEFGDTLYYYITASGAGVGTGADQVTVKDGKVQNWDTLTSDFASAPVSALLTDAEEAKHIKATAKWEMNGKLVESVKIAPVMNDGVAHYVLAIETKDMPDETDDFDVIGTITLKAPKSTDKINGTEKEYDLDVAFNLSNKKYGDKTTDDENWIMNFKDDLGEEEEDEINLFADMGRFEVNTIGQGELVVKTNVDYNEGIEGVASDVNYVYFNSNNPTFNRIGDLYLNADEGTFLYKVNKDGTLSKMDAPYDEDEEAFKIRTRVIGSYVIAEEELDLDGVNAAVAAPSEPVAPVSPSVSNPATGAAC